MHGGVAESLSFADRQADQRVWIWVCLVFVKLFTVSEPQFLPLWEGNKDGVFTFVKIKWDKAAKYYSAWQWVLDKYQQYEERGCGYLLSSCWGLGPMWVLNEYATVHQFKI